MKERIGFIGLGIMGRGMSHNLLKAGFEVGVWNRTAERMIALAEAGAATSTSPTWPAIAISSSPASVTRRTSGR
jgi:3-hydroxyisobutyrate dehydrogenase-like beta-hydroxyacid dehydrogenase